MAMTPELAAALLRRGPDAQTIGQEDIRKAAEILRRYKEGKANLEARIVEDELWWELRHWEAIGKDQRDVLPTSAWLFNAIINKHADAMDNVPEPVVLPREASDRESAEKLSEILPVVLEYNDFEATYSDAWWEKLKHGTAAYGVFWSPDKNGGLGDIDIRDIDLLKLFWEPGITDIQDSKNLFVVELIDDDILAEQYPQLKSSGGGVKTVDVKEYLYDDTVDTTGKSVVVDWYYKVKAPNGKTLLHYIKFVGDALLYASENDPRFRERGFYDHGQYPIVLDCLFPEKGTPIGFGYVAICKDPQLYIDKLFGNILDSSLMATRKRFFVSESTAINEQEFLDWKQPLVHVAGEISDARVKEIVTAPLGGIYAEVARMKIDEMKDTAANRDVNSGGTGSGVTAAAAIAALQEAGNKVSRDMIAAAYRKYTQIARLSVELMRQFYDEARSFRIMGAGDSYDFVEFSNAGLRDQVVGVDTSGAPLYRVPIFDLKIKAQKKNPFSRMEQNETAKELYRLGFFNPQNATASLAALSLMSFEGIDEAREKISEGGTLYDMCVQLQQEVAKLRAALGLLDKPGPVPGAGATSGRAPAPQAAEPSRESPDILGAREAMTSYGQRVAERSRVSVD